MEKELQNKDECFIGEIGDTAEPELQDEAKKKRVKRIIIFSVILLIAIAATVIIMLFLKKSNDKKESGGKENSNEKFNILFNDSQISKPLHTNKKYEVIKLKDNDYTFILLHDPKTLKGGLEIRTKFGFHTEIIDGFAHYAEHIFFGGTEKVSELDIFSICNQYNEFLNAYTWNEETVFQYFGSNYTYDILLDYVSDFIQRPKLNQTYLETEINVIISEFDSKNRTENAYLDILSMNSNPEHGFYQTVTGHTGNKQTLGNYSIEVLSNYLKNYFKTIFKPENCVFLLYSSKSIEEMRELAQKYFNFKLEEPTKEFIDIFNKKIQSLDNEVFLDGQLGKIALFNNSRQTPILVINFPISQKVYVESLEILNFLFNDNKENSLLKFLYDKKYISNKRFYSDGYFKKYQIVTFSFHLTKDGCENIDDIIKAFFAAINTIKEDDKKLENLIDNLEKIKEAIFKNIEEKRTVFPTDINDLIRNYYFLGAENMLGNPHKQLYTISRVKEILSNLSADKCLISIDSPYSVNTSFITNDTLHYTRDFNVPFKINPIPNIEKLNTDKSVGDYNFKIRDQNEEYTHLTELTKKPCYEEAAPNCQYNEYNPKNDTEYISYIVQNSDNILSLMKIDRSFGVPFVKGYINIILYEDKYKEYIKTKEEYALYYLLLNSINFEFMKSDLFEAGTKIEISEFLDSNLEISFSTYNDLLDKVVDLIKYIFKEPINEAEFSIIKERYYLQKAKNKVNPKNEMIDDILRLFKRFVSVDTYVFDDFPIDYVKNAKYEDFKSLFENITNIKTQLSYLTFGDISLEQANSSTNNLASLINVPEEVNLKESAGQKVEIPVNTSILYSLKSPNIYEKQGVTLVMYEFDKIFEEEMTIYSYCVSDFFFDYIRTQRGSGYTVQVKVKKILGKNYLYIYSLGKVYSPEQMDRFINEAIKESFSFDKCNVDLVRKHLKNVESIKGYAEDKFEELKYDILFNNLKTLKEDKNDDHHIMTYQNIIEKLKDIVVKNPKRIAILYHRADLSDEELDKQHKELDENYLLNPKIKNEMTTNITFLGKYLKDKF